MRLESETYYGSEALAVVVGNYLWGTLQDNHDMDNFVRTQLHQHPEVSPQILLCLFEHRVPWLNIVSLNNNVDS